MTLIDMGYSKETSMQAIELAEKYDGIYAAIGMHPDECNVETDVTFLRELSKHPKVVAIGEVGLDYHYEETNKEMQAKYFIEQIKLANELKLPVCIHSRDSDMDMLALILFSATAKSIIGLAKTEVTIDVNRTTRMITDVTFLNMRKPP